MRYALTTVHKADNSHIRVLNNGIVLFLTKLEILDKLVRQFLLPIINLRFKFITFVSLIVYLNTTRSQSPLSLQARFFGLGLGILLRFILMCRVQINRFTFAKRTAITAGAFTVLFVHCNVFLIEIVLQQRLIAIRYF
jgi:hypothetical protein